MTDPIRALPHDTTTPDVETASDGYAGRFAGPVGEWLLGVQAGAVRTLLRDHAPRPMRVLEVGGGHGQLAGLLTAEGHALTVHGSAVQALRRVGRAGVPASGVVSTLWRLPFADRSFDLVVAIRLLAHVVAWRELLHEMGRVSRGWMLIDFAPLDSANALAPLVFRWKRRVEGNTRPYFCYATRTIVEELASAGFETIAQTRQFALPMALHRGLGRPRFSRSIEAALFRTGVTRRVGSPALLLARRRVPAPQHDSGE